MARSVLFMQPRAGCRDELVSTFERLRIAETAIEQKGCLSVELQVPEDEAAPVLVTALWSDRDDYQGWLNSPRREETREEIFALLEDEPDGVVYEIRVAVGDAIAVHGMHE